MSLILDCTSSSYNSIILWKFRFSALGNDQHLDHQRFFFNGYCPYGRSLLYLSMHAPRGGAPDSQVTLRR